VKANPYPDGFDALPEDDRNAYFAAEATAYRERQAVGVAPRFRLYAFNDVKPDNAANYLIKGLFPRVGLAVIWGPPKCGKSFWAFDALMHVALGWNYRGHRVASGPVVYCALEGQQGFKRRIEAFRLVKLSEADGGSPPFYLMPASLSLVADCKALIADIRRQLGDAKPIAVCIDTLNRSLAGSENSDEDMSAYIRAADSIRDAFDCLAVIIHHCGHGAERPRGHSSLMGALDVQIGVKRDAADNIVAELELAKDGEVGLQFVSRLRVVEIGVDKDRDVITSCVVEEVDGVTAAAKTRPPRILSTSLPNSFGLMAGRCSTRSNRIAGKSWSTCFGRSATVASRITISRFAGARRKIGRTPILFWRASIASSRGRARLGMTVSSLRMTRGRPPTIWRWSRSYSQPTRTLRVASTS
jgi:hypothetical protein